MSIIDTIPILLLDSLFDITAKALRKYRLVVDKSGMSIKVEETPGIDERIAKIDEAKTSLLEGVRLIDELRETAQNNKRDAEAALLQINELASEKANLQKKLDSMKEIAQSDVETFREMAGIPSVADIRRERLIGFVSGVVSSLVASGVIGLAIWAFGVIFSK